MFFIEFLARCVRARAIGHVYGCASRLNLRSPGSLLLVFASLFEVSEFQKTMTVNPTFEAYVLLVLRPEKSLRYVLSCKRFSDIVRRVIFC